MTDREKCCRWGIRRICVGLVIILIGLIIYFVLRKNSSYGNFHNMIFALGIVNVFIGMVMYIDYSAYVNDVKIDGDYFIIYNGFRSEKVQISTAVVHSVFDMRPGACRWLVAVNDLKEYVEVTNENYNAVIYLLSHAKKSAIKPKEFYSQICKRLYVTELDLTPPE